MFTFGYKSKVNGPLRALAALAVGIMMVSVPDKALTTVVKVIAAFLLASGVVSLLVGLKDKEIEGAIRFSFSRYNTMEEMDIVLDKVKAAVTRFRKLGSFR